LRLELHGVFKSCGAVMLWDRGYWEPEGDKSPEEALAKGDFEFTLKGKRLHGSFVLVRMRKT
jgi:bifunctional non-homologous end joining protein LigD